jgi:hypothetical protein
MSKPKKNKGPQVRCPKCGRRQNKSTLPDAMYWCGVCQVQFDDDPDEGGDYSARNPAARLEREERNRGRK